MSRQARTLLALVFFLHAGLGAAMGLSVDEAHYLLYALHPALSYFDHPPLVGWVQWPGVALHAPTAVLRLLPGLLWLATAALAYRLALRLAGDTVHTQRAGLWTLGVLALAPLLHVLGIGLLPDTLLMFFSVALMGQTLTLMQPGAVQRPTPWLLLGVLLGLAGLSKYTAILAAAAVALCLLAVHGWRLVRKPWLWLATGLALLMVTPVALWNAQNQWISFTYQAKHGAGSAWQASHVLRFLLVQLLVYGPLLLWGWGGWRHAPVRHSRLLLGFFAIPFAVLAAASGGGSSLPHWTAPAWVALAPFAGLGLARAGGAGRRWLIGACVAVQVLVCVGLLGLMLSAGQPFMPATRADVAVGANPFADLHGWERAGQRARELAAQQQLDRVAVQNWTLASRLGWYARPLPVQVLEDRFDQFDLWAGDLPVGGSALLVDWSHMPYAVPLGPHGFARCEWLETQVAQRWGADLASFRFYACHGWSGEPQPRLTLPPT
ncbi:MAG: glycosyltransferase family 39 protein [Rhodoferax sp.]|nr:glycosyltransferase family 39 protein [Rhodoferax sp.]MDP3650212.1 glycosyltransferase family 39 protein [Rhodoferax sp.]